MWEYSGLLQFLYASFYINFFTYCTCANSIVSVFTQIALQTIIQYLPKFYAPLKKPQFIQIICLTNDDLFLFSSLIDNVERVRSNARYMTSLQPHKITPPSVEQQASRWVDPSAVPEGMTMTQALMKLRDHMNTDSMKLSQWLEMNK